MRGELPSWCISEHAFARLAGMTAASVSLPLRRDRNTRFLDFGLDLSGIEIWCQGFTFYTVRYGNTRSTVRKSPMRKRGVPFIQCYLMTNY